MRDKWRKVYNTQRGLAYILLDRARSNSGEGFLRRFSGERTPLSGSFDICVEALLSSPEDILCHYRSSEVSMPCPFVSASNCLRSLRTFCKNHSPVHTQAHMALHVTSSCNVWHDQFLVGCLPSNFPRFSCPRSVTMKVSRHPQGR